MPHAALAILDAGLAQLGLDLDLPARTALVDHARLLLAWTEHVNLTAIRDPERVAREHILDSLAAVGLLRAGGVSRLLDLGSGGGYPGIPLAVALPDATVALVESVAKKARFLETAVGASGLGQRVAVVNARAEALRPGDGSNVPVEAVCVRAVADLGALAGLAAPLLAPGGWLVAWKRGDVAAEIAAAAKAIGAAGFARPEVHAVRVDGLEDHRLVVATLVRPPTPRGSQRATRQRGAAGPRRRRW
jgi:16S rRNA (guanine527-N7)-methyltransferase